MLQRIVLPGTGRDGHAYTVRDQRQHVRSALHEFLHILESLQIALDQALVGRRQARFSGELFHVIAIGFGGGHASSRGVRLLQKSGVGQVSHDVANGGGAKVLAIAARQRARAHGLSGGDVGLHDRRENLAFPPSDAFAVHS